MDHPQQYSVGRSLIYTNTKMFSFSTWLTSLILANSSIPSVSLWVMLTADSTSIQRGFYGYVTYVAVYSRSCGIQRYLWLT